MKLEGERDKDEDTRRAEAERQQPLILIAIVQSFFIIVHNLFIFIFGFNSGDGGIFGALGIVKDAIKDKLTPHPTEAKEEIRETREPGVPKAGERLAVDKEGIPIVTAVDVVETPVVEIDVEEKPAGATASAVEFDVVETPAGAKATDQMSGQTFNDVGRLDDEGRVRVDRPGGMQANALVGFCQDSRFLVIICRSLCVSVLKYVNRWASPSRKQFTLHYQHKNLFERKCNGIKILTLNDRKITIF